MKSKKYILVILGLLVYGSMLHAQENEVKKFVFGINETSGITGLSGTVINGFVKPEGNYQAVLDGRFFFSKFVGIGLGVGYAEYSSTGSLNSYTSSSQTTDDEGESFEYRITATGIKEKLKLTAIEIPVFLSFRTNASKGGLLIDAGLKLSLPLKANYQCTEGSLETKGYYETYNVEFADLVNHGIEKIDKLNFTGNLATQTAYSVFADIKKLFPWRKINFCIGLYGAYGLNSVLVPQSDLLINYPGTYNSLCTLSEKVNLLSYGLKLGLNF